jgi:hypothetical protein
MSYMFNKIGLLIGLKTLINIVFCLNSVNFVYFGVIIFKLIMSDCQ